MHYSVATSAGIFRIIPDIGLWKLFINDVYLGTYPSAERAAEGVTLRKSGWDVWDLGKGATPESLDAWERNGQPSCPPGRDA
jgi:hypothetical protein